MSTIQQLGGARGVALLTTLYLGLGEDGQAPATAMSATALAAAALAAIALVLVFRLPDRERA